MKKPLIALTLVLSPAPVFAQEPTPPLYAGVESVGASPMPQDQEPVLFFEAKAHWPSLGIAEPRTAWEFAQRGMYKQDDLEDVDGAVDDYHRALDLDSHLLIARARLGTIALQRARTDTSTAAALGHIDESIAEFREILVEQPYRAGMHLEIAEGLALRYRLTNDPATGDEAVTEYRAEIAAAPQCQAAHYALAFLLRDLGRGTEAAMHIDRYLALAAVHGDPYPYKILAAERLRQGL